ncbi:extended synaptotagmin-1-like [Sinocyclocheilus anshuiensis]|uniref:extended synaptotagmin-1-like n=1 Tax=Sinocyclocheilus anshuiensis TaxID=1608454 RepID=UPI0007B9CD13|nr:PREDICTED: extended synaptotagmin-1-like [Sinocyclocheilus anshuiensis]
MSRVDAGPKNDSDSEKKTEPAQDSSLGEMDVPKTKLFDAKAILWTFGKCLTALLPVYLAGYYRMSTSLVVFGMMVYAGWKHSREAKEARLKSAIELVNDKEEYISSKSFRSRRDLPSWVRMHKSVSFVILEKKEKLLFMYNVRINPHMTHSFSSCLCFKVIQQAWPFIGQYLEKLLTETIAPSIRGSSTHLQTLCFTKVDFGGKPMKVVGVKAHTENEKGQILLDVYISYVGDVEINVEVKRYFCKAGVKGIQLHGMMRVILEPLIGDVPIVGAVTMFFIQRPGVVRIHLLEADGLASKDNYVKGVMVGMSDPYALLRVGPQTFKSRHLDNTLNPKWDEMYEVIAHEVPGQELEVEVFDKDADHDDFLGRTKLDLGIVKKSKIVDEWFTLKDTRTGRVHLRLEWLTLEADTERLEEVTPYIHRAQGVLMEKVGSPLPPLPVYLDKAEALPMKKGNKDPNPIVQISVQDVTHDSRICWNTVNPQWEDAFTFFIRDPSKQDISIQVKDNDRVQDLGSLSIPVSRLLSCQDLNLDEWFNLENSGPESRIHINTVLRVLWLDEADVTSSLLSSDPLSKSSASRPQKTMPHSSFATEGMLRIHLVEGQNLVAKDNMMGGMVKGKSDPYVKIQIGGETFKSQVIKENLSPTWNEMYEVVLTQLPGQELTLEVFDKDMDMKDDFMGRLKMNLSDIISSQYINEWFTLSDGKRGRVHLALEWLPAVTQPEKLQQVLQYQSKSSYLNKTVPTAALLFVYVERAHELPLKKSGKEPKVGAELILRRTSHRTTVCDRTSSPRWDEAFHFLVQDPLNEDLVVKLTHNWDFSLGSVVILVKELLSEPDLMLDQWLDLDGASPQSQILLRAQLKILCSKETESSEDHEEPKRPEVSSIRRKQEEELVQMSSFEEVPPSPVSRTSSVSVPEEEEVPEVTEDPEVSSSDDLRPLHTIPDPSFGAEGVLRLHLLEAEDLVAKDNMMGRMVKGKSDPYVKIHIGDTVFKSYVIKENLNPTWNEMYELVMTSTSTSDVLVEVFDKDVDQDDFLGRMKISLQDIIQSQLTDKWFSLSDVKHGRVHMVLEWLPTVTQPDGLQKALQLQSEHSYQNKSVPSAALFFILLERAHDLPLKKSGKEPKAAAELVLGDISHKTKVCDRSTSPEWSEAFHFLIHNPTEEILIIKLSSAFEQPLGSVVLPIRELLSKPDLLMDQWLSLDGAGPDTQILLRAQLKILDSSLDTSVLHRKKPVVEEEHSVSEQREEKAPIAVEHSQAAVSKDSEKKTLPTKGLSELAAFTLPVPATLPEEHQKPMSDAHHTPSVPKTLLDTEDLSNVPDSTTSEGGCMEPVKTFGSAHEEQKHMEKAEEQSGKKVSPSVPAEESNVSSSTDVRPQKTSHGPSFGTKGVLRIHLLEAQDLVAKDNMMGGMVKGKSDPYVKIHIRDTTFKSYVIKENLNPTWNEMYEMVLSPDNNLDVKFEVYDKDFESDDFLGRFKLKLGHIISTQYDDEWFTLNDIKHGRVHLVLEWLPTSTQRDRLDQVMQMQSSQTYQNKSVPSAALLFIYLERAHDLPLKKSGKEPKAAAELVLGATWYKTKVCDRSTSPYWNEAFDFLVHDPKKDMLVIKISSAWDQPMGSLVLPIRELLSKPDLLMDQWLNLDGASPKSQILLRAQLKILDSKMAALIAMGSGPVLSNMQTATTGQIKISLFFQKKLTVIIHACSGLVTSSKDSLDTYVSLILLPDKNKATKRKTSVKKKNLNPEFNERFEFDMSVEDAQRRELSVSVKNASSSFMNRDKDLIGQVQIDLGHVDLISGVTEWFDLKEEQN